MSTHSLDLKIRAILGQYFKSNKFVCSVENFHLKNVPFDVSLLSEARSFNIKRNCLESLPSQLRSLTNLQEIDISFNVFEQLPREIGSLWGLRSLQCHHNQISQIDPSIFEELRKLEIINLNHNAITSFPESISSCIRLRKLHLSHNQLSEFPDSIDSCRQLTELLLGYNRLQNIPESVGRLIRLKKLILHKNQLEYLPENLADLVSLKILDIAANNIQVLPSEINDLSLDEFYYEENPLLQLVPVASEQVDEVMPLAELCLRMVARELKNRASYLHVKLRHFPLVQEILDACGECALCGGVYQDVWIECVKFVKRNSKFLSSRGSRTEIPIRTAICSHSCFNSKDHQYYGVASV